MIDNAKLHIHILHNKTAILQTSINSVVSSCNFSDSLSGNKLLMLVSRLAWAVLQLDLQYTKYMQGSPCLKPSCCCHGLIGCCTKPKPERSQTVGVCLHATKVLLPYSPVHTRSSHQAAALSFAPTPCHQDSIICSSCVVVMGLMQN